MMIVSNIAQFLKRTFERCRVSTYYGFSIILTLPKSVIFYCIYLIYFISTNNTHESQNILCFPTLTLVITYKTGLKVGVFNKSALI